MVSVINPQLTEFNKRPGSGISPVVFCVPASSITSRMF
jgi:hypothetical protein